MSLPIVSCIVCIDNTCAIQKSWQRALICLARKHSQTAQDNEHIEGDGETVFRHACKMRPNFMMKPERPHHGGFRIIPLHRPASKVPPNISQGSRRRHDVERRQRLLEVAGFYRCLAGIIPGMPKGYKANSGGPTITRAQRWRCVVRDPNWLLGGGFRRSRCWLGYHNRIGNRLRNIDWFRAGLMSTNHARPP
jgi:hypothetical protein